MNIPTQSARKNKAIAPNAIEINWMWEPLASSSPDPPKRPGT